MNVFVFGQHTNLTVFELIVTNAHVLVTLYVCHQDVSA